MENNNEDWTMPDTTGWDSYPFEVDGVQFASLVKPNTFMAKRIAQIPAQVFVEMNTDCIREIIGDVFLLSIEELKDELERVNEGASEAVISLA